MTKPLEAAIFDLGGVVFGISVENILQSWAKYMNIPPQEMAPKFGQDSHYRRFETDDISPGQYREHVYETFGARLSDEEFDRGWNSIYLELLPGIESLLKQLQQSLRLVALTNTNYIHARDWRARYADILTYFEKVFASHEIKARKPDAKSFQIALNYLGIDPGKVIFFDDNRENVLGAIAVGIRGFVVASPLEISEKLQEILGDD